MKSAISTVTVACFTSGVSVITRRIARVQAWEQMEQMSAPDICNGKWCTSVSKCTSSESLNLWEKKIRYLFNQINKNMCGILEQDTLEQRYLIHFFCSIDQNGSKIEDRFFVILQYKSMYTSIRYNFSKTFLTCL